MRAAQPVAAGAAVAVTSYWQLGMDRVRRSYKRSTGGLWSQLPVLLGIYLASVSMLQGAVLPEDRADLLFHSYDGGGVSISGPSMLVRKSFASNFSASANYYVDKVSSASIDVVTTASPYTEERTQYSVGPVGFAPVQGLLAQVSCWADPPGGAEREPASGVLNGVKALLRRE